LASCQSQTKKAGSGSVSQWYGSADPDPYQNVTDPKHCIELETKILKSNFCYQQKVTNMKEFKLQDLSNPPEKTGGQTALQKLNFFVWIRMYIKTVGKVLNTD
jgi:hypothetical protein